MYIFEKINSYPQYGTGLFLLLIQNQIMAVTNIIHNYNRAPFKLINPVKRE